MSSIIKSGYIKHGAIINLQERMQFTYTNILEDVKEEKIASNEVLEDENVVDYSEIYEQAIAEKDQILLEAKTEANSLLLKTKEQIRIEKETATQEIKIILETARNDAEKIILDAQNEKEQLLEKAYLEKKEILMQAEPEVIEVIKTLVAHIIHEEVASDKRWISYVVSKMILKEKVLDDLVLYLSPNNMQRVKLEKEELFKEIRNPITLESDESLDDLTCMLETKEGSILYNISEGIDKIIKELNTLEKLKIEGTYD